MDDNKMTYFTDHIKAFNFTNKDMEVEEWNDQLAESLTLNNVILSLYIVLGITGNVTVIFIYGLRMKGKTEDRYFIPYLAVADLLASCVCASFAIAVNMMQVRFDDFRLCKTFAFFATFTTFTSILLLLIIAVHRYLKVCKPLRKQMTLGWKRFAMLLAVCIAFSLSVPMTKFYGTVAFPNPERDIRGLRCSHIKEENRAGSIVFSVVIGLVTVTTVASLISLYGKIGYTIFTHFRQSQTADISKNCKSKQEKDMESPSTLSSSDHILNLIENRNFSTEVPNTGDSSIYSSPLAASNNLTTLNSLQENADKGKKLKNKQNKKRNVNRKIMHKFSLIFMLITFIFLVCYIPKAIVMLLEALNPKFWEQFSDNARAGILFVYRMYIINNISNPFIYAFLDGKFSQELKDIFRKCKKR